MNINSVKPSLKSHPFVGNPVSESSRRRLLYLKTYTIIQVIFDANSKKI